MIDQDDQPQWGGRKSEKKKKEKEVRITAAENKILLKKDTLKENKNCIGIIRYVMLIC